MARDELTMFSYEILGLVGDTGAGAHDLLTMARRDRLLDWAGESQYYVEPKRLARLGYLEAHKEPGRTRERTVYTLTEQGLEALRAYARTPVQVAPIKSDALLRLLICDLVGEPPTRASLGTLRADVADLSARLDEAEARAATLPHREVPAASPSASCAACSRSISSWWTRWNASWPRTGRAIRHARASRSRLGARGAGRRAPVQRGRRRRRANRRGRRRGRRGAGAGWWLRARATSSALGALNMPPTTRADPGYSRAHTDAVIEEIEPSAAVDRAVRLAAAGGRRLLGIAGAPGAGKSTLAAQLADALGDRAAVVPMDGFHLAQAELERLGRADRKGAQDTFDAGGFVALLRRLRAADEPVVYAPAFRREIEEPIAGAIPVPATCRSSSPRATTCCSTTAPGAACGRCWTRPGSSRATSACGSTGWCGATSRSARRPRYAAAWVERSDQVNARLVATTRARADLVVRVELERRQEPVGARRARLTGSVRGAAGRPGARAHDELGRPGRPVARGAAPGVVEVGAADGVGEDAARAAVGAVVAVAPAQQPVDDRPQLEPALRQTSSSRPGRYGRRSTSPSATSVASRAESTAAGCRGGPAARRSGARRRTGRGG